MQPERSSLIVAGEVRLAVDEYGVDQPDTLVLVHGYPDSSAVWQKMIPLLSPHVHVVTYDVRGCGRSSAPARREGYALPRLAQDFRAVIDAVSPQRPVHLLGHDWGGVQSWEAVCDPQLRDRIRSFTCISGPCLDHVGHWIRQLLRSRSRAAWTTLGGQMLDSWYIGLFNLPGIAPALWKGALGGRWHRLLASTQGVSTTPSATQERDGVNGIELYRANMRRVLQPQRRATTVPVQLIVPRQDDFVGRDMALSAEPWVEQLWCREIEAGHWAPLSHPETLATLALEFIARQRAPA